MALINWNWTSPDMAAKAVSDVNEAANANYKEQQKRNTDAAFARNLDSKGNLTGGQWADIARMGGSPEDAARLMAYRGNQSDTMAKLAQNAYTSYISGANPHAGDSATIKNVLPNGQRTQQTQTQQPGTGTSDSSTGLAGVLNSIGRGIKGLFTNGGDSNVADSAYRDAMKKPNPLDNDKTGFVTPDMKDTVGMNTIPVTSGMKDTVGFVTPDMNSISAKAISDLVHLNPDMKYTAGSTTSGMKDTAGFVTPDMNSISAKAISDLVHLNNVPVVPVRSGVVEATSPDQAVFGGHDSAFDTSLVSPSAPEKAPEIPVQSAPPAPATVQAPPAPAPQGATQEGNGDYLNEYWAQVHPELAMGRMTGQADAGSEKDKPDALTLPKISIDTMSSDDKVAAAKMLASKGLLNTDGKYTEGDLRDALGNYVSQLQASAGPAPQLGRTQSVSITPGKPPTITTSTDTASYNKQMQDWYKAQMEIVSQVRKEVGDSFAQVYQQKIDRKKLAMEIIKFDNDVKQNNTTRQGMDQLAKATSNVLKKEISGKGQHIDPTTFQDANALEAFGKQADAFVMLKNSGIPGNIAEVIAQAKNYSVAEGIPPTEGMLKVLMMMGADPSQLMQIKLYDGNGNLESAAITLAQSLLAKGLGGQISGSAMTEKMAFKNEIERHSGKGTMGDLNTTTGLPDDNTPTGPKVGDAGAASGTTPPPPQGGGATTPPPGSDDPPTPKGSWFNTPKENHFVGTNIDPTSGAGNTYFVTARDADGNATEAQGLYGKKYKIVDAGQGVHLIPEQPPAAPARRSGGKGKGKGAGSKTQTAADRLKAKFGQK